VRLGYRAWRAVHWAAYACWPVALIHGLGTGSDTRQGWMLAVDGAALVVVVAAVWWRAAAGWPSRLAGRVAALASSVAMPLAVGIWLVVGPLRPGWARTAGTPQRLLAASSAASNGTAPPPASAGVPRPPFTATFSGTADQRRTADGLATITLQGSLAGVPSTLLDISLRGRPREDGLLLSAGTVELGPPEDPSQYQGVVSALQGGRIQSVVANGAGDRMALTVVVEVGDGTVRGVVNVTPVADGPEGGGGG